MPESGNQRRWSKAGRGSGAGLAWQRRWKLARRGASQGVRESDPGRQLGSGCYPADRESAACQECGQRTSITVLAMDAQHEESAPKTIIHHYTYLISYFLLFTYYCLLIMSYFFHAVVRRLPPEGDSGVQNVVEYESLQCAQSLVQQAQRTQGQPRAGYTLLEECA